MHELPFAKSIFKSVMEKAVENDAEHICRVVLDVGELRDFVPEIVQKYWDYIAKGTIGEGAVIEMNIIKATASCDKCGCSYELDIKHLHDVRCPKCNYDRGRLLTGRELKITGIEIR